MQLMEEAVDRAEARTQGPGAQTMPRAQGPASSTDANALALIHDDNIIHMSAIPNPITGTFRKQHPTTITRSHRGPGTFREFSEGPGTFRKQRQSTGIDSKITKIMKIDGNGLRKLKMG